MRISDWSSDVCSSDLMFRNVCGDIDQNRGGYVHPRIMRATEDMLKRLLLAALPHNHIELFNGRSRSPAPAIVRRVEEYIHYNFDKPICLSDLIAVSGVSGRWLHSKIGRAHVCTPVTNAHHDFRLLLDKKRAR